MFWSITKAKELNGVSRGSMESPTMYRQELKSQWFKGSYDNKLHSDNPCVCAITVREK